MILKCKGINEWKQKETRIMTIQEQIVAARAAQAAIKDYTQEQVDKLVYEVAKIINKNAVPLAKEAVEETGLGYFEDKIGKNTDTPATFWAYLKDKKSVGIINEDPSQGLIEVAHPIGVIGAITPATNPPSPLWATSCTP